ncbi:AbrB/MazE/SpoVT family DNA-binding domain-containing protein [Variovorax robiniae]|uniref:AbrB/MazE/SpoVT family DNA-binding domain-containing protein n=1 Tax=Variovorax robiniae TaxID=1836199 RepID=A0ABU8XHR4_9BURK
MAIATMTTKGQITMPLAVRTALGLRAGSKVDFVPTDDGFKVVPVNGDGKTLKGRFAGRVKKTVTLKEMDAAIAQGASARLHRGPRKS